MLLNAMAKSMTLRTLSRGTFSFNNASGQIRSAAKLDNSDSKASGNIIRQLTSKP